MTRESAKYRTGMTRESAKYGTGMTRKPAKYRTGMTRPNPQQTPPPNFRRTTNALARQHRLSPQQRP